MYEKKIDRAPLIPNDNGNLSRVSLFATIDVHENKVEPGAPHYVLPEEVLNGLMNSPKYSKVIDLDKISMRDGMLGDLNTYFHDVQPDILAMALQIVLLQNKDFHEFLGFSERADKKSPFVINRSAADEFFGGLLQGIGQATSDPWCAFSCLDFGGHHGGGTDCGSGDGGIICCAGIACAAVATCACWGTAKSIEIATQNTQETTVTRLTKVLGGLAFSALEYGLIEYFEGDALGSSWNAEMGFGSELSYNFGKWALPLIPALFTWWASNCISGQIPCVPHTPIPEEKQSDALVLYGKKLFNDLVKQIGEEEAKGLCIDIAQNSTILGYINKYAVDQAQKSCPDDKVAREQYVDFAKAVLTSFIESRAPELAGRVPSLRY
jgi:hypothetical protein